MMDSRDIDRLGRVLISKQERLAILKTESEKKQAELERQEHILEVLTKARDIVNLVLAATQQAASSFVGDVVSLALSFVYGEDYQFKLDYSIKRNQSEARPVVVISGEEFSPRDELGGGVIDVASLGLRLACWAIDESARNSTVFVLDEPAKFVSADRVDLVGEVLRELSQTLGIQIIMVSHSDELIDVADRAFRVTKDGGTSRVERIR